MRLLICSLLLTVLLSSIGVGWLLDNLYSKLYFDQEQQSLSQKQLQAIGSQIAFTLDKLGNAEEFVSQWAANNNRLSLEILEKEDFKVPGELKTELSRNGYLSLASEKYNSFYHAIHDGTKYLVLRSTAAPDNSEKILTTKIFTISFYLLIAGVVMIWLWPLVSRLKALKTSASKLGKGRLDERIETSGISLINDIELEFNRMAQRIENLMSDVQVLRSAVSHELRTPLAKMRFGLDTLLEGDNSSTQQQYLERLSNTCDEMVQLVEALLNYAQIESKYEALKSDNVDLLGICKKSSTDKNFKSFEIEIIHAEEKYDFYGDKFYLKLLIDNLVENAVKYGKQKVAIKLNRIDEGIRLSIEDDGVGIQEKMKEEIFKPFTRNDQQAIANGYGLGLALAKRIADWHNIKIAVSSSNGLGGARFDLVFPNQF